MCVPSSLFLSILIMSPCLHSFGRAGSSFFIFGSCDREMLYFFNKSCTSLGFNLACFGCSICILKRLLQVREYRSLQKWLFKSLVQKGFSLKEMAPTGFLK